MKAKRLVSAALLIAAAALLAGCGRYGPLKPEAGSSYPLAYPAPALAGVSAPSASATTAANAASQGRQFSPGGNYIDPSVRAPVIYTTPVVSGLPEQPFTGGVDPALGTAQGSTLYTAAPQQ